MKEYLYYTTFLGCVDPSYIAVPRTIKARIFVKARYFQ